MAVDVQNEPGIPVKSARMVVTAAATRERLAPLSAILPANVPARVVIITAETDNTGVIAIGGTDVIATVLTRVGTPLLAGDSVTLQNVDLTKIWVDATVSGDGVTYTIFS